MKWNLFFYKLLMKSQLCMIKGFVYVLHSNYPN